MIVGRFAPSPSASLHLGNLRTAALAWLCARSEGGTFRLRIDDVTTSADPGVHQRVVAEGQIGDLERLGLDWDGPIVYQSASATSYRAVLDELSALDAVYPCFCTRAQIKAEIAASRAAPNGGADAEMTLDDAYPGTCASLGSVERERLSGLRSAAWRVRAAGTLVELDDVALGHLAVVVDDFVVERRDGGVAYNLAVVVDDDSMGVTQVVRGLDLWPTTARQAFVYDLLGRPRPSWHHVALVVGEGGVRLSKSAGPQSLDDLAAVGVGVDSVWRWIARSVGAGEASSAAAMLAAFDPAMADLPPSPSPSPSTVVALRPM